MGEIADGLEELRAEFRRKEQWLDLVVLLERTRGKVDAARAQALDAEIVGILEYMVQTTNAEWVTFADSRLEQIYRSRKTEDSWRSLAGLFLDRSERQSSHFERYIAARRECARIFEVELGEAEGALMVLLSALQSDVLFAPGIIQDLERLGRSTGEWEEIITSLSRVAELLEGDPRLAGVLKVLGRWSLEYLSDDGQGVRFLQRALSLEPYDLNTIQMLEDVFRRRSMFSQLGEVLVARADALQDPTQRIRTWLELAQLAEGPLDDSSTAAEAYEQVLLLEPTHRLANERLDHIYTDREAWDDLLVVLRRQEQLSGDAATRRRLQEKIAHVLSSSGAVEEALQRFRQAYDSPRELAQALKREVEHLSGRARSRYMTEIGNLYMRELNDSLTAHHYYQEALSEDSQIVDAAEPLADAFLEEEQWERALPLLESLVRTGQLGRPQAWLHKRWMQIAQCCDRLGRPGPALNAYREAYELNPRDLRTLKGLGRVQFEAKQYDACLRTLTVLLRDHVSNLTPTEVVAMHFMSGVAHREQGNLERAIAEFEETVRLQPRHLDALRILVEHYGTRHDWASYVKHAESLVALEKEPLVRFRQFSRLGEVWGKELNRPDLAMQAYRGALDIDPNSIVVLRKLLELYTQNSKYSLAVKVLERIIEREDNPERRANLHYTAGVLYRDHVNSFEEALRHFEEALDSDRELLKAFEAIDRLLTQHRQWKELERAYRRMIKRFAEDEVERHRPILILLWGALAEVYRSRLGHVESAINAYQFLRNLKPDDEQIPLILAELYSRSGDLGGAEQVHRKLLEDDPMRVESYSALMDAYMKSQKFDAAWCMAAALSFMRVSLPQEEHFYQQYLGKNLKLATGPLTQEHLLNVVHPDHDVLTSTILSYVAETLRPFYGTQLKSTDINPKRHTIGPDSTAVYRKLYDYVGKTLAVVAMPELFRREGAFGLHNVNVEFAAIGVGEDRLNTKNDRENAFYTAKLLYSMRPENYLATIESFPPEALHTMFCAALESCDPSFGFSKQVRDANFDRAVKELRKLPEHIRTSLRVLVERFKKRQEPVDIPRWLRGVDHTSNRIGLLICGDLAVAASCLRYGFLRFGNASDEARLRELTIFATSESYILMRQHLGLAISPHRGSPWF